MSNTPSEEQQRVIDCNDRLIRVQAGPGTGKTFTLLHKIKAILSSNSLLPTQSILFCTYTNALTNNNRKDLKTKLSLDTKQVKTCTLDSFIANMACHLDPDNSHIYQDHETEYQQSAQLIANLFSTQGNAVEHYLELLLERYPYVLIDEIQDIYSRERFKDSSDIGSPKGSFLKCIVRNKSLNQLIVVGDTNQAINSSGSGELDFLKDIKILNLNQSYRNNAFSMSSEDRSIKLEQKIKKLTQELESKNQYTKYGNGEMEFFKRKLNTALDCLNTNVMVLLYPMGHLNQLDVSLEIYETSIILHRNYHGQRPLPQAFYTLLQWYAKQQASVQSFDSQCMPFYRNLKPNVNPLKFKKDVFSALFKEDATVTCVYSAIVNNLKDSEESPDTKSFKLFYEQHTHLHDTPVTAFTKRLLVSTIYSAKGLEADEVFVVLSSNTALSPKLNYVAHTRHKNHLHVIRL